MDRIAVGLVGGSLAVLVFIHFAVDWIFQSHDEAMVKHNNWKVRAKHCAIYTVPFLVFLWWQGFSHLQLLISASILFLSHFIEDTYIPVFLWAKYIRRPLELKWKFVDGRLLGPDGYVPTYLPEEQVRALRLGEISKLPWRTALLLEYQKNSVSAVEAQKTLDKRGFVEFVDTAIGKILMITIDQIIHIMFLLPIAMMLVYQ